MCKKKYSQYKIILTTLDGSKKKISTSSIKKYSYSMMVDEYKKVRDSISNDVVKISFIGVNDTDEGILFTKEYEVKDNNKYSKTTSVEELIQQAKEIFDILSQKKEYHNQMKGVYDKQSNVLLHAIETIDRYDGDIEQEKLRIMDELIKVRSTRRINKNEWIKSTKIHMSIEKIKSELDEIKIPIDTTEYKHLDKASTEKLIMKEVFYKTDKERVHLIKQLNKQYGKIVTDEENKKIICYNKAK